MLDAEPTLKNEGISARESASLRAAEERAGFQFERPDWTLFRSADTLVLKELTHNALQLNPALAVHPILRAAE